MLLLLARPCSGLNVPRAYVPAEAYDTEALQQYMLIMQDIAQIKATTSTHPLAPFPSPCCAKSLRPPSSTARMCTHMLLQILQIQVVVHCCAICIVPLTNSPQCWYQQSL